MNLATERPVNLATKKLLKLLSMNFSKTFVDENQIVGLGRVLECCFLFILVLVKIICQTLYAGMFSSMICYHLNEFFHSEVNILT